jgi:hypothetical protein
MSNLPQNNNLNITPIVNIVVETNYPTLTVTPSPEIVVGGGGGGGGGAPGIPGQPGPQGNTGNTGTPGDLYSTTSNTTIDLDTLNLGDELTLVVSSGLAYSKVQSILVANSVSNYFYATVSSYSGTNLNIITGSESKEGSGAHSSWTVNLAGAVGQIGPQGSAGTTGNTGNAGTTGNTGNPGTTGNTGFGTTGNTGNPGTTGNTGDPGTTGNTGFGTTGNTGDVGTTGNTGNPGTTGNTGNPGTTGNTGNPGTTGNTGFGTTGNTGNPGTTGNTGFGTTGNTGNPGTTGNTGFGTTGNTGNPGTTGNTGFGTTGNTGNPGTTGNTGNPGTTGNTGNPGTTGNTGNPGTTGNTGFGTTGNTGNPGTTGTTGTPGDIYSTTSSTTVDLDAITIGTTVNLTVSSGLAYTIGQSVLIANSVTNYFNATVSSYSSTTLSVVVVSKNGTGSLTPWAVNLAGAVGQAGEAGPRGTTGNTGNPGTTGNTGNPGTTGNTGNPGTTGNTGFGTTGNTGNPGTTGNTGFGTTGNTGFGTTGNTGNPGTTGNTGNPGTTGNTGFGTTGNTGNPGTTGNTGNPGTTGNTGNPGTTGNTGFGTTGNTGNPGTTGNTGNPGTTGNTGNPGTTGNTGFGTTGNTGNPGTTGNTGFGTTGNTGNRGTTGNTGNPGTTGTTGTPGDLYKTTSTTSINLNAISIGGTGIITVDSGLAYTPGMNVLVAVSLTVYVLGNVISYSGTTLSYKIIGWAGTGTYFAWTVNILNLNGATGPEGKVGPRGTTGNTGNRGTTGNTGNPGTTGTTGFGTTGTTGNAGTTGNTGNPGTTGNTGQGVIAGGTPGFYLTKDGIADYGTTWSRGAASDGSAIIYKLLPNTPQGLSAGDLISYNGATAWAPTPRTYLVTPSLWQTRKTTAALNSYPSSVPFPNEASSLTINGATSIPGELIQISLDSQDGAGNTFGSGTWWFNYSIYGGLLTSLRGSFVGSYSGLKIVNGATFYTSDLLAPRDKFGGNFDDAYPFHVAGYAILIRGTTYNALDGRGGPYGSTLCNTGNPNQRPLGTDSCYADGVDYYPIVCDANKGFTYNGVYFACPPI